MKYIFQVLALLGAGTIYISVIIIQKSLQQRSEFHSATTSSGFHVITNYALMVESPWKENQTETNITNLWQRQHEIEETLQRNLDHPLVEAVHLLIDQESAKQRLNELQIHNKHKIYVRRIKTLPKYRDFFLYISEKLQNRVVSVMNMDIHIGEGFENLNKSFLTQQNICYALTRNGRQERRCNMATNLGYCETGYIGSHDVYIFVLKQPLTDDILLELDYQMHLYGGDNVLLWIMKNMLGMTVLNPCRHLRTYHNHCVNIHGRFRPRINRRGKSVSVPPSGLYA